MALKLKIEDSADEKLTEILHYKLTQGSHASATAFMQEVNGIVEVLLNHPDSGHLSKSNTIEKPKRYKRIGKNQLMYYTYDETYLYVFDFVNARAASNEHEE